MNDWPFEVLAEQETLARFREGMQAFLYAHLQLATGVQYVRVVDHSEPLAVVSWRFEYGGEEMPVAVKETET